MSEQKFRSIGAFRAFEEGTLAQPALQPAAQKFRSIGAFRAFEEGALASSCASVPSSAQDEAQESDVVSPLRVLAAVKRHPDGVKLTDLLREIDASPAAIGDALLRLLKENLARLKESPDTYIAL